MLYISCDYYYTYPQKYPKIVGRVSQRARDSHFLGGTPVVRGFFRGWAGNRIRLPYLSGSGSGLISCSIVGLGTPKESLTIVSFTVTSCFWPHLCGNSRSALHLAWLNSSRARASVRGS